MWRYLSSKLRAKCRINIYVSGAGVSFEIQFGLFAEIQAGKHSFNNDPKSIALNARMQVSISERLISLLIPKRTSHGENI